MSRRGNLYERAGDQRDAARPLWHLDGGHMFFVSPLRHNGFHQHGAPVYLAGVYGDFHLRIAGGAWNSCRSAIIPAGLSHELDVHGEPIAGLYIEPSLGGVHALTPLAGSTCEVDGALLGGTGDYLLVREIWEDASSAQWSGFALNDLLNHARRRAARPMDPRIAVAAAYLVDGCDARAPVAELAGRVGLSASRFQHLFTRTVGVAFRRYRSWCRMREAITAIVAGESFTAAAYTAGFADQPHFNRDFRCTFGAPPSISLRRVRI